MSGARNSEINSEQESRFEAAMRKKDLDGAEKVLPEWRKASPDDPELAVAEFNLYLERSKGGAELELTHLPEGKYDLAKAKQGEDFELRDPKSGKKVGKIGEARPRRDEYAKKAVEVLRGGIEKHPERLDMRFGLAKTFEMLEQPQEEIGVLTDAVKFAAANPESLRWRMNKDLPGPAEEFIPDTLHVYAHYYINQQTPKTDEVFLQIAKLAAENYPKSAKGFNDVAAYYAYKGEQRKAIEWMMKALNADPKDALVAFNVGLMYEELNDAAQAKTFFERAITNAGDDGELKKNAQEHLRKLGKSGAGKVEKSRRK